MSVRSSRKAILIGLIISTGVFGYSQYASASQIEVVVTQSELLEENEKGSKYNVQLEFNNPSLLLLTAGKTDFVVYADETRLGDGKLDPFVLPALSKTVAKGTFLSDKKIQSDEEMPVVKISGVTKYNVLFTSLDVPFVYYPTEEQARNFIQQE